MKITRHTGPDIRHALRAVRDSLGADAVILATRAHCQWRGDHRRHGLRCRQCAGRNGALSRDPAPPSPARSRCSSAPDRPRAARSLQLPSIIAPARLVRRAGAHADVAARRAAQVVDTLRAAGAGCAHEFDFQRRRGRLVGAGRTPRRATGTYVIPTLDAASDVMTSELKSLRRMLETQLAQLAWKDLTRRAPLHTEMLRELTEIGIEQGLAARDRRPACPKLSRPTSRAGTWARRSASAWRSRAISGLKTAAVSLWWDRRVSARPRCWPSSRYAGCCATAHGTWRWWPATRCASAPRIRCARWDSCWAYRFSRWTVSSSCPACSRASAASAWFWWIPQAPGSATPAWRSAW